MHCLSAERLAAFLKEVVRHDNVGVFRPLVGGDTLQLGEYLADRFLTYHVPEVPTEFRGQNLAVDSHVGLVGEAFEPAVDCFVGDVSRGDLRGGKQRAIPVVVRSGRIDAHGSGADITEECDGSRPAFALVEHDVGVVAGKDELGDTE